MEWSTKPGSKKGDRCKERVEIRLVKSFFYYLGELILHNYKCAVYWHTSAQHKGLAWARHSPVLLQSCFGRWSKNPCIKNKMRLHHYFGEDPSLFATFWNWSWKSSAINWPNYELWGGGSLHGILFNLQDGKTLQHPNFTKVKLIFKMCLFFSKAFEKPDPTNVPCLSVLVDTEAHRPLYWQVAAVKTMMMLQSTSGEHVRLTEVGM